MPTNTVEAICIPKANDVNRGAMTKIVDIADKSTTPTSPLIKARISNELQSTKYIKEPGTPRAMIWPQSLNDSLVGANHAYLICGFLVKVEYNVMATKKKV